MHYTVAVIFSFCSSILICSSHCGETWSRYILDGIEYKSVPPFGMVFKAHVKVMTRKWQKNNFSGKVQPRMSWPLPHLHAELQISCWGVLRPLTPPSGQIIRKHFKWWISFFFFPTSLKIGNTKTNKNNTFLFFFFFYFSAIENISRANCVYKVYITQGELEIDRECKH